MHAEEPTRSESMGRVEGVKSWVMAFSWANVLENVKQGLTVFLEWPVPTVGIMKRGEPQVKNLLDCEQEIGAN
jgi:hypothetical protein